MSKFWSPIVHQLIPYTPGEQPKIVNLIKLNTNENPYPPSPKVREAILAESDSKLRLYPDPEASALKNAIAAYFDIKTDQIFVGNGSDEVLAHVFNALLKHTHPIHIPDISYSFYPTYAKLYDVNFEAIALNEQFEIDIQDYLAKSHQCGGVLIPNPNAPTGRILALKDIEQLVAGHPDAVVVIDEAYVDFGGESAVKLINQYPNLLVVQTLSKSRSLAGMRVGFAMGHPDLINGLERVKNSFNSYPLDRLAIVGAVAAINDKDYFDATCSKVIANREKLVAGMTQLGFDVLPSAANFIFAKHQVRDASEISQLLREKGIIVRHFSQKRIQQFLRISIGTEEECQALLSALSAILG